MYVQPVFIPVRHIWTWPLAFIVGLVISSVFTGLSVGLPLGLACCTSSSTFTQYDGYLGPQESDLYFIIYTTGTNIINICTDVCNADSACAYFDYDGTGCFLYPASQLQNYQTGQTGSVYLKNGYSLPNTG